ncbi:origin recognition complex subunit Orc5 [Schizosaccharomyces cryophilus OY26]|uniref:Origin recognition complex subunit Orc5 n=1 Tax=Schizosaccharomyces cryophilus (strain OY26 / ATCC MYA-4695 / CBS 11777 / NBRC 106824 / NRRL Y48691) TaxID=653667 RepID=S9XAX8_SCHCR|nr:origin recognition complex subunit Orc5 [Schizosaccharomyces cryophilus OY26]EPY54302.1 origin recognition complex subunit Orc5 [Schizosaccharomyces cryophilus OY26]
MKTYEFEEQLKKCVFCRNEQIKKVVSLLFNDDCGVPCLVLYGVSSTGKSYLLNKAFKLSNKEFIWINLKTCFTTPLLLYRILIHAGVDQDLAYKKGTQVSGFLHLFQQSISKNKTHVYLVLDQIDQFSEISPLLFTVFADLALNANLTNLSVVLTLSTHPAQYMGTLAVPIVFFPQYMKDEILEICQNTPPVLDFIDETGEESFEDEIELSVWMQYCAFLWNVFGSHCLNNYRAFRNVVDHHWPQFVQPIVNGNVHPADYAQLHKLAKHALTSDLTISRRLHIIEPTKIKHMHDAKSVDLPLLTKYLLISAFLASYNPSRLDAQFFSHSKGSKRRGRKRKNTANQNSELAKSTKGGSSRSKSAAKLSQLTLGPKAFELERLFAIYYAICPNGRHVLSADVFSQITSLSSLKMLLPAHKGSLRSLDSPRFKVNVSREFVFKVAKSVSFPLESYLADEPV